MLVAGPAIGRAVRVHWVEEAWVQQTKGRPERHAPHPGLEQRLQGIRNRRVTALQLLDKTVAGEPRD